VLGVLPVLSGFSKPGSLTHLKPLSFGGYDVTLKNLIGDIFHFAATASLTSRMRSSVNLKCRDPIQRMARSISAGGEREGSIIPTGEFTAARHRLCQIKRKADACGNCELERLFDNCALKASGNVQNHEGIEGARWASRGMRGVDCVCHCVHR
jgi:hypothetical protein